LKASQLVSRLKLCEILVKTNIVGGMAGETKTSACVFDQ
jgi:hypothetical protein